MASEEGADALKIYWEHFFKAETGTYEKSTWLDLFLAEFIVRLNEGCNPKDLIKFCPLSGVVSLVGCELLCGIHRVTSSINTHFSPPLPAASPSPLTCPPLDADDTANEEPKSEGTPQKSSSLFTRTNTQSSSEILRQYLLGGLAWRCLVMLKALGVEGLSCCRQLSSVLIWLFGELSAAGRVAHRGNTRREARVPIHELFSNRIWSKQKSNGVQNQSTAVEKGSLCSRSRYNGLTRLEADAKAKKKSARNSEISSDSGDTNDDLQVLNRSMTIKVCPPNDDFDYFNTPIRSSSDFTEPLYSDPFYTPRKAKPKADDYMKDKHRQIINSEIGTFEFTLLIIDLLQELCKAESSLSGSEGSQISMQCINFSLKNLCSLQFGSMPNQSYDQLELANIKVALTELLIVSLDQVLVHADLCAKLINIGILPMLLRILEDVVCKSSAKYNTKVEKHNRAKVVEKPDKTESEYLLKFVFGIAYSITAFFYCLLMQCRSVEKLREFTDQFRLYGECFKGGLLKECIELMIRIPGLDDNETVILVKKLIECIGKLVSGMKRVRSEVIHSAACPRSRHKACRQRVAAGMHHHHDILGEAGTGLPLPSACCVSVLYGTLTSLVPDEEISAHKVLRNKILRVMLKCGVCCCFSPTILMESIVRLMLTHNSVASLCLQLLEHTVYGDLGASVLIPKVTDQLPCSICEQCDDNRNLGRKYCAHGVSPMERKNVWSFLIHYNSLLQLDNHNNVLHATVSHLLKVTPKCRMEMKYELLFSVIYPTFIVSKHRYIIRLEESAYFLTVSCLNIFANLLNTVSFAEQFIQKASVVRFSKSQ
ncbi:lysosomal-trafficking regulator-like [Colias croceus]|uniref:lysosomal-trafficking regulator-like n=1 Tax=Colias crocea TaxID=72248 RepID=UPI001E27B697|nr:lysosomal-trafficking regulator-like [Colias croceus]